MDFELEDPLASFKEQQQACTISELFASESDHIPSPNCLSSTHFHISFRCEAISLILQVKLRPIINCTCSTQFLLFHVTHMPQFVMFLQVQLSCNLDPFVAYLAKNYLHRFMSRQEIPVSMYLMIPLYRKVGKTWEQLHLNQIPRFQHFFVSLILVLSLQQGKPWLTRLVVISCLSLASKMKNNTPLSFSELQVNLQIHVLKKKKLYNAMLELFPIIIVGYNQL